MNATITKPKEVAEKAVQILESRGIYSTLEGGRSQFGFSYYVTVRKSWNVLSDDYCTEFYTARISDHYANMAYRCRQYNMFNFTPEEIADFLQAKIN